MANECYFVLRVVSRRKDAFDKLLSLMQRSIKRIDLPHIYGMRGIETTSPPEKSGGFWVSEISGYVGWDSSYWFVKTRENEQSKFHGPLLDFTTLCPKWKFGVECWTEELGLEFQGHRVCTSEGVVLFHEQRKYYRDENGNSPPGHEGFGDDWGDWLPEETVYGKETK